MKILVLMKYWLRLFLTCMLIKYSDALKWDELMESALWGTSEISNSLEPYIVENFPTANVSKQCVSSLIAYAEGLKNFEPWAIKMFDATGKPPSSFLKGTITDFGLFDECMSLEVERYEFFKSQFCMLSLKSSLLPVKLGKADDGTYVKIHGYPPDWVKEITHILKYEWGYCYSLNLGICIPSTCSEGDLINIVSAYGKPADIEVQLSDCQVNEPRKWTTTEKFSIFSVASLLVIIITGTVLDVFQRNKKQKNVLYYNEGTGQKILKSFSLISNLENLLQIKTTDQSLDFIHGIKFWIIIWVQFLHMFAYETLWGFKRLRSATNFGNFVRPLTILYDNSLPNTTYFIFLNGFISTYSMKNKQSSRQEAKKRKIGILKLILIKYLRIVPSIMILMMMVFVIPVTFNGPIWNSTWSDLQNKCLTNGWKNLLFISNFVSYNEHCFIHMWVLSSLLQYHIICLPLLNLSKRHPKLAVTIGCLTSLGCGVRDFIVSVENEFLFPSPFALGSLEKFHDFVRKIYFLPYNHFATFGIGMIFGWIDLKNLKMNKISLTICWIIYLLFSFSLYYVVRLPVENLYFIAFHNAFRGIFFSLQMGWLMYTCLNGTAGILGRFFSWKGVLPFSKILNSVTIYHPILIVTYETLRRERLYTSMLNYIHQTLALIIFSSLLGAILFLMVDSPFNRLCDMWEGKNAAPTQKNLNACSEKNFAVAHSDELVSKNKEKEK